MFKYKLPNENNDPIEYETESNSVIIIGANGSGKSKLGAWMEMQDKDNIHRISAQKSLNFREFVDVKSYEESSKLLFYGSGDLNKDKKWNYGNPTTTMLNDYDIVLSNLFALNNLQYFNFVKECKKAKIDNKEYPIVPETVIDILQKIWIEVFPHRHLIFEDSRVISSFEIIQNDTEVTQAKYKANEMSDGERSVLYLIAQCLCVPENKTIIIDEPEMHLHRSIINKLWLEIEKSRTDCLFIYITHDTSFASEHMSSEKLWVKEYDGNSWKIEKISESTLPEKLLLDILGNRKNVLFVEGTYNSYDTKLYKKIYNKYYVVPCGSCASVINYTKSFNNTSQLHNLKCYGLIDRDYRSEYEIKKYENSNIFCLKVAEVENLFLVPELLEYVNKLLGNDDKVKSDSVKKYIVEERFLNEKNKQIYKSVIAQTKYKLSCLDISNEDEEDLDKKLKNISSYIEYEKLNEEIKQNYDKIKNELQYEECLKLFNRKDLIKSVGHFFGLRDEEYCELILRKVYNENDDEIINIILNYLPLQIER